MVWFIRESVKEIRLRVEQPSQWSKAALLPMMDSSGVRSWLVVEAFVTDAKGRRRELDSPHTVPRCPPWWDVHVGNMEFPLTLTCIEPPSPQKKQAPHNSQPGFASFISHKDTPWGVFPDAT